MALPAGQRMPRDVTSKVAPELTSPPNGQPLDTSHIGIHVSDPVFLTVAERRRDSGRRHGKNRDIRDPLGLPQIRRHPSGPKISRELGRPLIAVTKPYLGPRSAQREAHGSPDQPGPDNKHPPRPSHPASSPVEREEAKGRFSAAFRRTGR
jgi:hypothetical protein